MKKTVLLVLVFLLLSTAVFVVFVKPTVAEWTIYIRYDGSVDPITAPIQRIRNIYTFTENVYASLVVERDNIMVDGEGYILQGTGSGTGIDLSERTNVTIRNLEIREFFYGVYLNSSLNNRLSRNNMTNSINGIHLSVSSKNTIFGNTITNNHWGGIRLRCYSDYNNVSGNNIANNGYGIYLTGSESNNINENNITSNNDDGIWLSSYSDYNNVSGNNIANNGYGIRIDDYSNNIFRNNLVSNNEYNFGVYGSLLPEFIQDIDDSNSVNDKPVYYWINRRAMAVPLDAGWVALINCTNMTIKNLTLTNNGQGILLAYTTNSTINKNRITNNIHGIYLSGCDSNIINENNITESIARGIYLYYSSNNKIYHNTFTNNTSHVYNVGVSINAWDNGVKGNYWSDYEDKYPSATELDSSGIWNTPYVIDGNNQDNYPLVPEFPTWAPMLFTLIVLTVAIAIHKKRLPKTPIH